MSRSQQPESPKDDDSMPGYIDQDSPTEDLDSQQQKISVKDKPVFHQETTRPTEADKEMRDGDSVSDKSKQCQRETGNTEQCHNELLDLDYMYSVEQDQTKHDENSDKKTTSQFLDDEEEDFEGPLLQSIDSIVPRTDNRIETNTTFKQVNLEKEIPAAIIELPELGVGSSQLVKRPPEEYPPVQEEQQEEEKCKTHKIPPQSELKGVAVNYNQFYHLDVKKLEKLEAKDFKIEKYFWDPKAGQNVLSDLQKKISEVIATGNHGADPNLEGRLKSQIEQILKKHFPKKDIQNITDFLMGMISVSNSDPKAPFEVPQFSGPDKEKYTALFLFMLYCMNFRGDSTRDRPYEQKKRFEKVESLKDALSQLLKEIFAMLTWKWLKRNAVCEKCEVVQGGGVTKYQLKDNSKGQCFLSLYRYRKYQQAQKSKSNEKS
jgi:hypothetical protein